LNKKKKRAGISLIHIPNPTIVSSDVEPPT